MSGPGIFALLTLLTRPVKWRDSRETVPGDLRTCYRFLGLLPAVLGLSQVVSLRGTGAFTSFLQLLCHPGCSHPESRLGFPRGDLDLPPHPPHTAPQCRLPAARVERGCGRRERRGSGRAQRLPRPGAVLALWASRLRQPRAPALGAQRRRHVFRGQRERPAAPGGAAQTGGRRGEDQGLTGSCRASAVLHAECLQGCPAGRCSSWKQPLPGTQILCFILKTVGKKFTEECF